MHAYGGDFLINNDIVLVAFFSSFTISLREFSRRANFLNAHVVYPGANNAYKTKIASSTEYLASYSITSE